MKRSLPIYTDLVEIPAGRFSMGSVFNDPNALPNETPRFDEYIDTFYIGRYPVTNSDYHAFITESGRSQPIHWQNSKVLNLQGSHPVVNVNFTDAEAYCQWLSAKNNQNYRLPTEEEWEKVARGHKDTRQYPWGNEWANYRCNSKESGRLSTASVIEYENAQENMYGVSDLVGNVWEWTSSQYEAYRNSEYTSSKYGLGHHVVKGGSFRNDASICRVSQRGSYAKNTIREYLGFRIVTLQSSKYVDKTDIQRIDKKVLREKIVQGFSSNELRMVASDIGIDPDEFSHKITEFAFELIAYCDRRRRMKDLIQILTMERPHIDWREGNRNDEKK